MDDGICAQSTNSSAYQIKKQSQFKAVWYTYNTFWFRLLRLYVLCMVIQSKMFVFWNDHLRFHILNNEIMIMRAVARQHFYDEL